MLLNKKINKKTGIHGGEYFIDTVVHKMEVG